MDEHQNSIEDEQRYEALRHVITNSGSIQRAARCWVSDKETSERAGPTSDEKAKSYARRNYEAILNPSPMATVEMLDYCRRVKEEAVKIEAMREAGWKSASEEGYDAFDPNLRPVDWEGASNPYPEGTPDHEEWCDGYGVALESADLPRSTEEESDEDNKQLEERTLDWIYDHTARLAGSEEYEFLGVIAVHQQMGMLAMHMCFFTEEYRSFLPDDIRERLGGWVNVVTAEANDRKIERIGTREARLGEWNRLLTDLKSIGADSASRAIRTEWGLITEDLYEFSIRSCNARHRMEKQGQTENRSEN